MTTTLLKYMFRGALKGIEEYEKMLEKEHMDPQGGLAQILKDKPQKEGVKSIDIDELLE